MACRHPGWRVFDRAHYDYEHDVLVSYRTCETCGAWLSLGPSNDVGCDVELRAALLAGDDRHMMRLMSTGIPGQDDEVDGYLMACLPNHSKRVPWNSAHEAGYLARCIATHEENDNG